MTHLSNIEALFARGRRVNYDLNEDRLMNIFTNSLSPDYDHSVAIIKGTTPPMSKSQAIQIIRQRYTQLQARNQEHGLLARKSQSQPESKTNHGRRQERSFQQHRRRSPARSSSPTGQRSPSPKTVRCKKCKRRGHRVDSCPEITCFRCNKPGHFATKYNVETGMMAAGSGSRVSYQRSREQLFTPDEESLSSETTYDNPGAYRPLSHMAEEAEKAFTTLDLPAQRYIFNETAQINCSP